MAVSADDRSQVLINGHEVAWTGHTFQPVVEEVTPYLRSGPNTIRVLVHNNQPGSTGLCLKLAMHFDTGKQLEVNTDDQWLVSHDNNQPWESLAMNKAPQAHIAGEFGVQPWGRPAVRRDASNPPSYLRRTFEVRRPVKQATAYLAALGGADVSINGQRVNKDYFSSGWTDYRKRVYYRAYDVTSLLTAGENAWGAVVVDGWYAGHVGWGTRRDIWGRRPRFSGVIHIEYKDGDTEDITTDGDWIAVKGPKKVADFLIGEEYDATAEVAGWDRAGATIEPLGKVDIGVEVSPAIEWHPGPPVVEAAEFPAQSVSEPIPGVYVYDLGQNFAGVARITVAGRKGRRVRIRYAERLNPDGTIYTRNLRMARATDYYTLAGRGEETWQPRQTFHGFQYVELSGVEAAPPLEAVTGIALSSDTPLASEFDCSDPQLNRLYKNILWTQRANFIDVPTDCPQRDERLGWTGDAQVYVYTATRVADVQSFFRKWLVDLSDAQRRDGQFPRVAPVVPGEEDGGPAWADAGVICPWEIYQAYGDRDLLAQQYPSMVQFVEFCRKRSKGEVLPPHRFHTFGDWLSVQANTPAEIVYMAYYARSVDLLRRTAEELGQQEDAKEYAGLLARIKRAFQDEYVKPDGRIHGDTQCAYVLALSCDLVAGDLRKRAADHLVSDIESRGWKLSTGFIGTKDLMLALEKAGRNDVALRLLHQPEYPGWMFSISHGATSIWERWDGWTPGSGFQDPGMNSFSHYSFGAVYGWMVENLGGIRNDEPGFGKFVIQPTFDSSLDRCRVVYDSIRGPIQTQWKVVGDTRQFHVTVPANTKAELRLPIAKAQSVTLDGLELGKAGLQSESAATPHGAALLQISLPSGTYDFTFPR